MTDCCYDDEDYSKSELSLRVGFKELAIAVIEQWVRDGKPECDRETINCYIQYINKLNKLKEGVIYE